MPLKFLTASQEVFDSLTEAQRDVIVETGRDTEVAFWTLARELFDRNRRDITARGVVIDPPPADVLAKLRKAAEPDIQNWIKSMDPVGTTILDDFRRAIGRD